MSRPYAVGALALSAALLATHSTEAQQTYLIHDLGVVAPNGLAGRTILFSGNHSARLPFRINNKNQVVFYTRDSSGDNTPWLWLPEDDSSIGLDAGLYELTVEDGSETGGQKTGGQARRSSFHSPPQITTCATVCVEMR